MNLIVDYVTMVGEFNQLDKNYFIPLNNKIKELESTYNIKAKIEYHCTVYDMTLLANNNVKDMVSNIVKNTKVDYNKYKDIDGNVGLIIVIHNYPFKPCQFFVNTLEEIKTSISNYYNGNKLNTIAYFKEDAKLTTEHYVLNEIIALLITKPIGIYKVQVDNQYLYVVYTGQSVLIDAVLVEMDLFGSELRPLYVVSKTLTKAINGEVLALNHKKFKDIQIVTEVDVNEFNSIKHERLLEFKI